MDPEKKRINIVVIGEKDSGKTSIISSLYQFCDPEFRPADWESKNIECAVENQKTKQELITNITAYTSDRYKDYHEKRQPTSALLLTKRFTKYAYSFKVYATEFEIDIWDTPALDDVQANDPEMLDRFLRESDVIMVAVDTPSVMEGHHCTWEVAKKADECAKMLRGYMGNASKHKMVIFVPTRCEKYYHEGRLRDVTKKVQELYRNFFVTYHGVNNNTEKKEREQDYFQTKRFAMISPLITMGDVTFTQYKNPSRLGSAEFHVTDNANFQTRFTEKILIGIANFLIRQNLCKKLKMFKYDWEDRAMAGVTLATKAVFAAMGQKTPPVRGLVQQLIGEGEWLAVDTKELIETDFDHGYKEFFA